MAAEGAILADGVPPIMTFHRAENRIIFSIAEEIMIDRAHARGDAQSAVQVIKRRLPVAVILVAASLKFNREQGLLWVLQCLCDLIHQHELMVRALADNPRINVRRTDHPLHTHNID